jgi:chromosome segregation ATPase
MVERHSPTPARAEAEGDIRLTSAPAADRPAGPTFADRLEAVERAVRDVGGILTRQLPQHLSEESENQRSHVDELAVELGGAFRSLVSHLEDLRDDVEALGSRVGDEATAIRERVGEDGAALREHLDRETASLREHLTETASAIGEFREELSEGVGRLEAIGALPARLGEGMAAVRDSVAEIAAAHAVIEERLAAVHRSASGEEARARVDETSEALAARLGEAAGSMRWEVQETLSKVHNQLTALTDGLAAVSSEAEARAAALQEGLERVDMLAEAVATIGRRRGFKQVVESDRRVREEQAAMTERLAEGGRLLSAQVEEVRAELEELGRAARDVQAGAMAEEIRRRVVDELVTEQLVQEMVQRVEETFDRRLQELAGRVDAGLGRTEPADFVEPSRGLFRRRRA